MAISEKLIKMFLARFYHLVSITRQTVHVQTFLLFNIFVLYFKLLKWHQMYLRHMFSYDDHVEAHGNTSSHSNIGSYVHYRSYFCLQVELLIYLHVWPTAQLEYWPAKCEKNCYSIGLINERIIFRFVQKVTWFLQYVGIVFKINQYWPLKYNIKWARFY